MPVENAQKSFSCRSRVKAVQEGMRTIDKYLVRRSVHTYDGSAKYKEGQKQHKYEEIAL